MNKQETYCGKHVMYLKFAKDNTQIPNSVIQIMYFLGHPKLCQRLNWLEHNGINELRAEHRARSGQSVETQI